MSRLSSALLMSCALISLSASQVRAADPVLEVRARLRIELERIERGDRGFVVTGVLLDESLSEPMPGWTVALRVSRLDENGKDETVYALAKPTNVDGGFRFEVQRRSHESHTLRLSAPGDATHAAPTPVERVIDLLGRRAIELRLHAPTEHPSSSPTLPIKLEIVSLEGAMGPTDWIRDVTLPVEIEVDGRAVATVLVKDGYASTTLALPPSPVGREIVLRASFVGDNAQGPASSIVSVRLVEPAVLDLAAERNQVTIGEDVRLSGHLRVGTKTPPGLSIIVRRVASPEEPEDAPYAATRTDSEGAFHVNLRAPRRPGRASFEASFPAPEAKERGLLPATSELVVVEVAPGLSLALVERRPAGLALGIVIALVIALGGLRLWRRLRALRSAAPSAALVPTDAPARKLFATLRLPSDRRVAGRVREAERGRPLVGARLKLRITSGEVLTAVSDEHGSFAFAELANGTVELTAEHDGHAPSGAAGHVPHRGDLGALDLSLMPLRGEMLRRYDELLAPYTGGADRLGRRTPRELADAAIKGARRKEHRGGLLPAATVKALRLLVEERCFSARAVGPDALQELERIARDLAP